MNISSTVAEKSSRKKVNEELQSEAWNGEAEPKRQFPPRSQASLSLSLHATGETKFRSAR
jgi:hypothetical protein